MTTTFQPVPDVLEVVTECLYASEQRFLNTFFIRDTILPWTAAKSAAAAAVIGNRWRDEVMPLLISDVTFDRVYYRDLGDQFGVTGEVQYNTAGGVTAEALPAMVCGLVQITCTGGAAPRRGRLFVSGWGEGQCNGDALTPTARTDLLDAMNAIFAATGVPSEAHVRVSRFLNNVKRDEGVSNTVASLAVRPVVGSQRDRRTGEGS